MDLTARGDSTELAEYAAILRRRWWIIVTGTFFGLLLGGLAMIVLPKTYSSYAVVQVMPTGTNEGQTSTRGTPSAINLVTESQRVRSTEVATVAKKLMGSPKPPLDLVRTVAVTVPAESAVLQIGWTSSTAEGARLGAQSFAQAYLDDRRGKATERYEAQARTLETRISELSARLKIVTTKLAASTGSSRAATEAERQIVLSQLNAFGAKLSDTRVALANVTAGEIITNAALPEGPSDPSPAKYLPSGLIGGLLLGIAIAVLYDRTDRRVRSARDVERVLDLPVLLDIPAKRGGEPLGLLSARSRTGQSFHELRHSMSATLGHGNHVLLVTGAAPGRGANIVTANMAASLARTGANVLLVCADLNSTVTPRLLGIPGSGPGLAEVLTGEKRMREVVRRSPSLPSLAVVPPGIDGDLAVEMLQREQMAEMIKHLRSKVPYVIIEAPSTALSADAQALADHADAAVVVIETPRTRYDEVRDAVRQIHRMGAAVLGAVVVPHQDYKTIPEPVAAAEAALGDRPDPWAMADEDQLKTVTVKRRGSRSREEPGEQADEPQTSSSLTDRPA